MRFMIMAAAVAALAFASTAEAKSCKDAQGHFVTCPAPAAAPAKPASTAKPCKDAKGHFVKCPAPAGSAAATANRPPSKKMQPAGGGTIFTAKKPAGPKAAPKCKTGVLCGDACIPKGKVCHKS
jgi:hypothetical protein